MMGLKRLKALGTMSGTSLDGVDAAVIETDGVEIFGFGAHAFRPYSEGERAVLSAALGHWPGTPEVLAATEVMERAHIELLSGFEDVDVIGFHGQTFAHDPRGRGTHQAGSGVRLAQALGRDVVWDFRSQDVARGGQGAPLAPFYHVALAKWAGARTPVAFLNLGGVGNLTWLDPLKARPEEAGACLAFDTGPANAPINDLMQARLGLAFDEGGALAREGKVDTAILAAFLAHPYFAKHPPKSLDRDDFKGVLAAVEPLSTADAVATLTAAAAQAVIAGAAFFPSAVSTLWVTGGGRHNGFLMDQLAQSLGCKVAPVEAAGMNGDMLEAQAFGYLAVRVLNGLANSGPSTTGVPEPVIGGQISRAFGAA